MKRLYYLTGDIDIAEHVSDRLHDKGVSDWNFHVLGKDKANMIRHHLHTTTPWQELDIIRSGERGVLVGFAIGILLTCYIALFTTFGESINLLWQIAGVLLLSFFGAWVGGLVGVSTENYKIRRFHDAIENGQYLLMVDVKRAQRKAVEEVVAGFPQIRKVGEDSTVITPFDKVATR